MAPSPRLTASERPAYCGKRNPAATGRGRNEPRNEGRDRPRAPPRLDILLFFMFQERHSAKLNDWRGPSFNDRPDTLISLMYHPMTGGTRWDAEHSRSGPARPPLHRPRSPNAAISGCAASACKRRQTAPERRAPGVAARGTQAAPRAHPWISSAGKEAGRQPPRNRTTVAPRDAGPRRARQIQCLAGGSNTPSMPKDLSLARAAAASALVLNGPTTTRVSRWEGMPWSWSLA